MGNCCTNINYEQVENTINAQANPVGHHKVEDAIVEENEKIMEQFTAPDLNNNSV